MCVDCLQVISLLNWLQLTPVKHARDTESSESEDCLEDENEYENVISDFASDSSTHGNSRGSSTASDRTSSRYKQSKCFNTAWLNGRKHWLKYEKDLGMFCLLCQKYNKCPFDRDVCPCSRIRLQSILNHE